jgi:hypothetical protein
MAQNCAGSEYADETVFTNSGENLDRQTGKITMKIVRSEEEIKRVEGWAEEATDNGTRYPDRSYEDGIGDLLGWLRGDMNVAPDRLLF